MIQNKRNNKKPEEKFHTKFNNNFRLEKIKSFNKTFPSFFLVSFQYKIFCCISYSFSSMLEKKWKILLFNWTIFHSIAKDSSIDVSFCMIDRPEHKSNRLSNKKPRKKRELCHRVKDISLNGFIPNSSSD